MKRVVMLLTAFACVLGAQAQTNKELERASFLRDSVADVLAEHRANYAKNENLREKLTPTILALEKEYIRLQGEYDRVLRAISQRDAKLALENYKGESQSLQPLRKEPKSVAAQKESYTPDKARMKRDLVANDYFANRLSLADYITLRKAQAREIEVKRVVERYLSKYSELLSLQRRYMEVPTKEEADTVAVHFAAKSAEMAQLDNEINSLWAQLYYNKFYAYDLLMERSGNNAMLDLSATSMAKAEREINENGELYQSDALVSYFARKKALAEYELQLASLLSLTTSRDSLRVVVSELKNRDYRLSKLSLQRRSFIAYEDVKVKNPTIYNSKNPVPRTKVYDYGIIYRIRVGLFSKRPNLSALRGVVPLSYTDAYNKGLYAYFVGGYRTEQEAKEGVAYLKKIGFRDPIIAVWVDGEYYSTVEEMRRSQSQYNIEITGIATLSDDMKARILTHKSDCSISRIGATFVVGTFEGKSVAEAVVADLKSINPEIKTEITKKP